MSICKCPKCLGSCELVSESDDGKIAVEKCYYCGGTGEVNPGDIDLEDEDGEPFPEDELLEDY